MLTSDHRGNSKVYYVNPWLPDCARAQADGVENRRGWQGDQGQINRIGRGEGGVIFGSYASGEADARSDVDLMVIGKVELSQFSALVWQLEHDLGRPINYVIYSEDDWKARVESGDAFVLNVTAIS